MASAVYGNIISLYIPIFYDSVARELLLVDSHVTN